MFQPLHPRQYYDDPTDGDDRWYSNTGYAVRYAITGAIIVLFLLVIFISYVQLSRRARQGTAPAWYSRWVPNSAQRPGQQMYPLHPTYASWPAPSGQNLQHSPPVYTQDDPPAYQPPPNASKVLPTQTIRELPQSQSADGVSAPPPSYASNR